jgi:hypothetical protein
MTRGCVRVSSLRADVPGIVAPPCGAVTRCVSAADTSLSLSLSLSAPDLACSRRVFGVRRGAHHRFLVGHRRAVGRGVCRCGSPSWALFCKRGALPSVFEEGLC